MDEITIRRSYFRNSKASIAAHAATYVPDNCTVALDSDTINLELCPFLNEKRNLIISDIFLFRTDGTDPEDGRSSAESKQQ